MGGGTRRTGTEGAAAAPHDDSADQAAAALVDRQLALAQSSPDIGYVADAPWPGAPLVITFAFVDWDAPNRWEFPGRTRKLRQATGRRFNRLFVRDTANFWYQHGVSGLGRDVDETAAALADLVASLRPASVSVVGQSMGAYAAILFGALLGADRVLAFGPLSYFRSDWARRDGDTRWLATMEKLERFPPARRYDDLVELLEGLERRPAVRIVLGDAAGPGEVNLDRKHAARLAKLPEVRAELVPGAPHTVVEWLIEAGLLDDLLRNWLIPEAGSAPWQGRTLARPAPRTFEAVEDGWREWIAQNLLLGIAAETLLGILVSRGLHAGEAQREIDKVARSPALRAGLQAAGVRPVGLVLPPR